MASRLPLGGKLCHNGAKPGRPPAPAPRLPPGGRGAACGRRAHAGGMSMLVAVDLGFGWTKAIGGGRTFAEPSVVGPAVGLMEGLVPTTGVVVRDESGREYFVGDLAIDQSDIHLFSIQDNKPDERTTLLLLQAAVAALVADSRPVYLDLVTGLPVDHFFKYKDALVSRVASLTHISARVDGRPVEIPVHVQNHKVVPQPFGSAAHLVLDDRGELARPDLAAQYFLVVDIGFHTVDLLAMRAMTIVQNHSRSLPYGLAVAFGRISRDLGGIPLWDVDRRLREGRLPSGYEEHLAHLAEAITAEVTSSNQAFDFYLITGGGGQVLFPHLLPGRPKVLADSPQMANVTGYLKLGARAWYRKAAPTSGDAS